MKPMILLPPILLWGLDPHQLAAILSHEIAHIRRYDLIVNLLQRIVEALLFFHPATWWISRRVSIERENCCDDLAVACTGRIQIRDMRTLETVASLKDEVGSPLKVSSMDITPDGRYLVAHNEVSVDQTQIEIPHRIHVWDLQTRGKPVFQLATSELGRKVVFSDDGRMIVGEFRGATQGVMLAAWKLPDEVIQRRAAVPRDANDRLGDGPR